MRKTVFAFRHIQISWNCPRRGYGSINSSFIRSARLTRSYPLFSSLHLECHVFLFLWAQFDWYLVMMRGDIAARRINRGGNWIHRSFSGCNEPNARRNTSDKRSHYITNAIPMRFIFANRLIRRNLFSKVEANILSPQLVSRFVERCRFLREVDR